jgi:hypothetical protein
MDKDKEADDRPLLQAEAAENAGEAMRKQTEGNKTLLATYVHIGLVVSAYW